MQAILSQSSKPKEFPAITRKSLEILQVNLGYLCNLSCRHCHVSAGPKRKENMVSNTINEIIDFMSKFKVNTLDLTGGAPEMNPNFERLVKFATDNRIHVIDRCNLVILEEPGYQNMTEFLAENQVEIVASLPCYLEDNVDKQRGKGVFQSSIAVLQRLNKLGYGQADSQLSLNLVYNPQGAELPPKQAALEQAYKLHLHENYGVTFDQLYTLTNMPIQRFANMLKKQGRLETYFELLRNSHLEANLDSVMCRNTVSIDWQGFVYDCDFNQMLDMPLGQVNNPKTHISELNNQSLFQQPINVDAHCFGCTAGEGSSCQGALQV